MVLRCPADYSVKFLIWHFSCFWKRIYEEDSIISRANQQLLKFRKDTGRKQCTHIRTLLHIPRQPTTKYRTNYTYPRNVCLQPEPGERRGIPYFYSAARQGKAHGWCWLLAVGGASGDGVVTLKKGIWGRAEERGTYIYLHQISDIIPLPVSLVWCILTLKMSESPVYARSLPFHFPGGTALSPPLPTVFR